MRGVACYRQRDRARQGVVHSSTQPALRSQHRCSTRRGPDSAKIVPELVEDGPKSVELRPDAGPDVAESGQVARITGPTLGPIAADFDRCLTSTGRSKRHQQSIAINVCPASTTLGLLSGAGVLWTDDKCPRERKTRQARRKKEFLAQSVPASLCTKPSVGVRFGGQGLFLPSPKTPPGCAIPFGRLRACRLPH